jgi:hypothetical protein
MVLSHAFVKVFSVRFCVVNARIHVVLVLRYPLSNDARCEVIRGLLHQYHNTFIPRKQGVQLS